MIGKDDEEHKKKIEELKDELTSIQEDLKLQNSVVNVLSSTNMETNDELQEAKKTAVSVRQQEQDQVLLWYESYAFFAISIMLYIYCHVLPATEQIYSK
jgi:chromosome segregation ATPase